MRSFSAQKAALTRAQNSGDPRKVVAEVDRFYADYTGKPLPDDWHRWNTAEMDAERQIAMEGWDL